MSKLENISIGCSGRGVRHLSAVDVDTMFRMVRDAGVYDHFDRLPQLGEERAYLRASEKYGVPIRTGLGMYRAGENLDMLERNLKVAKEAGGEFHNVLLYAVDAKGHYLTDAEVTDIYLKSHDLGLKTGVDVGFEVHIDMWSEDFRRVTPIAEAVRARGAPFNLVLDHSHVLLKIDNCEEQDACGIRKDVESGALVIDPFEKGNVIEEWLRRDMVPWLQVRPVSPNGPKNVWAQRHGGGYGRACQYPFVRPAPGTWHSQWHAYRVEPCKQIVRHALKHHLTSEKSPLKYLTTDMIDMPDYGENAKYSLFDQNVAIAQWVREEMAAVSAVEAVCR